MEKEVIKNSHDKFFKESFSQKEIAQSFIKEYLPENIHKQLNLNRLEIIKDSFIDKELREHFSDILYRIRIAGKFSYIYLLFEHKSYIESMVGLQLLRNMVKIWEGYLKQNKRAKKLPVIIPMVIYHGPKPWNVRNLFSAIVEDGAETKVYIPDFKMEVFDISHIPDEQIKGEILLRVCFLIQKYIFQPELIGKIHEILGVLSILSDKKKATEYLEVVLRYLFATVDEKKEKKIKEEIEKSITEGGDIMPTIAEKWLREGIEKGVQKEKIETAEKMIEKGMTNADIRDITGLSIKNIEEIRKKKLTKK